MHGCGASCLLDMGGQLLQGGRAIYKYIPRRVKCMRVCVQHPCVYGTYKTQLVCTRHCLAQTAVCSRTCLPLQLLQRNPQVSWPAASLFTSVKGRCPGKRVCDQCWLFKRHDRFMFDIFDFTPLVSIVFFYIWTSWKKGKQTIDHIIFNLR